MSTIHWFYIAISLDKEISSLDDPSSKTLIGRLLLEKNKSQEEKTFLLLRMSSVTGTPWLFSYRCIAQIRLTGTVIGFILMLLPIGEIKDFDPQILQKLLSTMSGGMAVALYTTLTGLLTSMILKFQYFILDTSLSQTLITLAPSINEA